jgi:hypothetical protein
MAEIIRFVMLACSDHFMLTDLCEQFGISPKTACKHWARPIPRGSNLALCTNGLAQTAAGLPIRAMVILATQGPQPTVPTLRASRAETTTKLCSLIS